MNEWELLVVAEQIEPGDSVEVELEDGETVAMLFRGVSGNTIRLLDQDGEVRKYYTHSLEELNDGNSFIVGKSDIELSYKEIMRNK